MIGFPIPDHGMCSWKDTLKTERVMLEADKIALEVVREVAREKNVRVEVIDVSTFRGKLRAKSVGIKETPTIMIGGNKIEGIPEKEQILKLLQQ
ncbi:MAG: thioredoxin family protein [Candidatus Bathyarchaeia archaeon]